MYTIRRNRKIITTADTLEQGIAEFLKEVNHGETPVLNAEEITNNVAVLTKFLEADKRFGWGPVTITKTSPREVKLNLHEARTMIWMYQNAIDHAAIRGDGIAFREPEVITVEEAKVLLAQMKTEYPNWEKKSKAKGE